MKYVVAFVVVAIVVAVGVVYFALSRTTISVKSIPQDVSLEFDVTIADPESDLTDAIPGRWTTVELAETKTFTGFTETSEVPDFATGTVTIVNESTRTQPLVATTRLLSDSGVLFRTQESISVGPNSRVDVNVKADEAGAAGNVEPTRFTIVALHASSQDVIYGESSEAMTGGTRTAKALTRDDANRIKDSVLESVTKSATAQAQDQLAELYPDGRFLADAVTREILREELSADIDAEVESVDATTAVQVQAVSIDPLALQNAVLERLANRVPEQKQLLSDSLNTLYNIKSIDEKTNQITLHLQASAYADITLASDILDKTKLTNLDRQSIESYFDVYDEIQSVEVHFSPFWAFQTPALPDHIEVLLNE